MAADIVGRISVVTGDITEQHVDAIVNAANQTLLGGGGVDGAIHRAAGPDLLEACRSLGGCRTGEAKITRGYKLPALFVIHTVGPVWKGGGEGEDNLLASCYRQSLVLAESQGLTSIAFPAISTGAYGFPPARATIIAVRTVLEYLAQSLGITKVVFVCHGDPASRMYHDAVKELVSGDTGRQQEGRTAQGSVPAPAGVPEEVLEQVRGQLRTIEAVHGIRFVNRDRLAGEIAAKAGDRGKASFITAAINSWVAINGKRGDVEIPDDILARILKRSGR
jgi:O-acetyl-ADP-ribose deacetylase (regulator of RNase III)